MSKKHNKEPELKGTLISVSVVGIFILVTWFLAFYLFIDRF
ncbi:MULTISPECIES: cytochrome c oxidase subunit 2A [Psychrobacillus]|uniref:Cytochrome c oxidase subunit 2A n=1 Tax=Psychrobacillus faecigallinarum TaxID=2762235 RepID=A0ABR8RBR9_9BACI|nr:MULTISPECIES: cytochrome c oxidase subunit 2A [Psychrobacillus]MBD7945236.1 cytochrome c oxidase subunit 2A [Psychrobacillus faecigallinarum]QEY19817.1 cytochrome c oxidase subunit 2A [Psychrobacillus sp. AK 1817]QGM30356.1 cytochrome c oxidase subunit 2A [Bacillus sp. N3536]